MHTTRFPTRASALNASFGIVVLAGLSLGWIGPERHTQTAEERAYREANGLKVSRGWSEGFNTGKAMGQECARSQKPCNSSREVAQLARDRRSEVGLADPVEGRSFERGFVFGYQDGFKSPEREEP